MAFLVTHPITARYLMRGQLGYLREAGFSVSLLTAAGPDLDEVALHERVRCVGIRLEREIRPLRDIASLVQLIREVRRLRPVIVSASTPKVGVLGMLAAAIARVPARVYTVRGLRLATTKGWKRTLLTIGEKVASFCAHRVVCVSPSLQREYVKRRLSSVEKTQLVGSGSSNGVDLSRFRPDEADGTGAGLRAKIGLHPEARIIGSVGRLVRDKGIEDLVRAFETIVLARFPTARLLVLGDFEEGDPVAPHIRQFLMRRPEVVMMGIVEDVAPWYRIMDVLAFPSYREGFPNAPLEAAASAVPAVAYEVTGTVDAIYSAKTGTLVPSGDWRAFGEALCQYLADPRLRRAHGAAARQRAQDLFSQEKVWNGWRDFYLELLAHASTTAADR